MLLSISSHSQANRGSDKRSGHLSEETFTECSSGKPAAGLVSSEPNGSVDFLESQGVPHTCQDRRCSPAESPSCSPPWSSSAVVGSPSRLRRPAAAAGSDLTPFQLEHGIGPVTEVVEPRPGRQGDGGGGQEVCSRPSARACHKMAERYVGPPLGDVTDTPDRRLHHEHDPQSRGDVHPAPGREEAARGVHDPDAQPGPDPGAGPRRSWSICGPRPHGTAGS